MQGTTEWLETRRGKITASRISDIMANGRGGKPSATRENYLVELALQRVTGIVSSDGFVSAAMQRGTELEPIARAEYEVTSGNDVDEVDFVDHPLLARCGASPDGLVGLDGLVEIKCPQAKQHLSTLRTRDIDRGYMLQIQWQLACTRRDWCDFVSYNPEFPERLRLVVIRVPRDDGMLEQITAAVQEAEAEICATVAEIEQMNGGAVR